MIYVMWVVYSLAVLDLVVKAFRLLINAYKSKMWVSFILEFILLCFCLIAVYGLTYIAFFQ